MGLQISEIDEIKTAFLYITAFTFAGLMQLVWLTKVKVTFLMKPVDFGQKIFGRRIFGESKTFFGFVGMVFFCAISFTIFSLFDASIWQQKSLVGNMGWGAGLGFIYMLGELPNSFVKRRLDIDSGMQPRGKAAKILSYIADQVDSVFCASLFVTFYCNFSSTFLLWCVFLGFSIHAGFNVVLWKMGVKSKPM